MYEHKSTEEKLKSLNIPDIIKFYESHSAKLTSENFDITVYLLNKILKSNNITLHTREENFSMSVREYGTTNKGKVSIYNPVNDEFKMIPKEEVEKWIKNGWEEKGNSHISFNKNTIVITNGEVRKYINPEDLSKWESEGWWYGEPSFKWSDESKQQYKDTIYNNYGVINVYQLDSVKKKSKQTCLEKYGVEYTGQAECKKINTKNTFSNRTSEEQAEINSKISKTKLEKYGSATYNNRDKAVETCLAKYGVVNTGILNCKSFYYTDNTYFDSSWELALWIYAKDHDEEIVHEPVRFEYFINGNKHYYIPDFLYNGKYIDLKGSHLVDEDLNLINPWKDNSVCKEKTECMRANNVELWLEERVKPYLEYIKNKYGDDYLKQFKIHNKEIE